MITTAAAADRCYEGRRSNKGACTVDVVEMGMRRPLDPRHDLANKSANFEWGYDGSGPAQLALAMLADATGDDQRALRLAQGFKQRMIGPLPRMQWILTRETVLLVAAAIERDAAKPARHKWNANKQTGARKG